MMHPARAWPIEDLRRWIEEDGLTHEAVGLRLGCASQTIGKLCAKHGIRCQPRGPRRGPGHPSWKGGRQVDADGYILLWVRDHPHARGRRRHGGGYVLEHRLVMEATLGRYLDPAEVVHHLNGVNDDNRPENLEVFSSNSEHLREELAGRCPNWTADGQARIRAGVLKSAAKRRGRRKEPDGPRLL
jgi:hypothetical protein